MVSSPEICFPTANTSLDDKIISGTTVNIARERTMSCKYNKSLEYHRDQLVGLKLTTLENEEQEIVGCCFDDPCYPLVLGSKVCDPSQRIGFAVD